MNAGLSQAIHATFAWINGPHIPPLEYRPYGAEIIRRAMRVTTPVGNMAKVAQKWIMDILSLVIITITN
jgi:hypothetical protein